jgi:hypothetical protein
MQPKFAIDGPGWSLSFQRRVGSANRGAIPYLALDASAAENRVLVPIRAGEALWIAVMAGAAILVEGRAGDRPLRVKTLAPAKDGSVLHMLDAVCDQDRWMPIDNASVPCADDRNGIGDDPLTIVLKNSPDATAQRVAIVPAIAELYEALSGSPAPAPTTERDEYSGWRLP